MCIPNCNNVKNSCKIHFIELRAEISYFVYILLVLRVDKNLRHSVRYNWSLYSEAPVSVKRQSPKMMSLPILNMGGTKSRIAPQLLKMDGQTQWRSCSPSRPASDGEISVLNSWGCAIKARNSQKPTVTYEKKVQVTIFLKI